MTLILGVLNVTPDSFSDGGTHVTPDSAIEHGLRMCRLGAEVVDVGGESTRPGARPVPADVEARRVLGVVEALAASGVSVSIDTMHAEVARAALSRGATIVNDVSGGLTDPGMAGVLAASSARYVIGHWRGTPRTMDGLAHYGDPSGEVLRELSARVAQAMDGGVRREQIVIDPGLGFAKTSAHNWSVLAGLARFQDLGFPVLIGASRKRFLAPLVPADASVADRDLPSAAITMLCAQAGVWGVRVHDVAASRTMLSTLQAWTTGRAPSSPPLADRRRSPRADVQ